MDTKLEFKKSEFVVTEEYEVIGQGGMIYKPCQIGEWWVMPANLYQGEIPPEAQAKFLEFKKKRAPVIGYLIADDMRKVIREQEEQVHPVYVEPQQPVTGETAGSMLSGIGQAILWMFGVTFALVFDPMLIAVLEDGRWICLAYWFD